MQTTEACKPQTAAVTRMLLLQLPVEVPVRDRPGRARAERPQKSTSVQARVQGSCTRSTSAGLDRALHVHMQPHQAMASAKLGKSTERNGPGKSMSM